MKNNNKLFVASKLTLAVQGALMVMFAMPMAAYADGDETAALTQPTNTIEIGVTDTSRNSAKFGEYNGLDKKGADLIGNINLRGGDSYNSFKGGDGLERWEIKGTDLNTTSGEISGSVSKQGQWSIGIGYDELRHNITDSYQTPFLGSMGGNNFTLPSTFGVINTTSNLTPARGSNSLTPLQLASFNTQDVHTDRHNSSFNAKYNIDPSWDVKFDFNHLDQSGAKLMGVAGDQANGPVIAGITWAGQTPIVIMNPTNYTTDSFNFGLNWKGEKARLSAGYYGSFFRDGYNSVSFNNPFVKGAIVAGTNSTGTAQAFPTDTMSTMPSNDFNQLNLAGGYDFTQATKLVGGLSYGRNTQNDDYSNSGLTPLGVPQNSLNGLVVTTHADMRLTNQTSQDLVLSGGLKYNERDNQTPSNSYQFNTINEAAGSTVGTSVNAPMSNRKTQIDLAADYRISKDQKLNLSLENEQIMRWCNNAAANNMQGTIHATYNGPLAYTAATCAQVPDSKENKLAANYKLRVTEEVNFSAGYGYSRRIANVSPSFYNPMQALLGGAGGEGFEVTGFLAYFQASRTEQLVKAGVNWQPTDKLSLAMNGRYTDDNYDSTYGVQNGHSWSVNLDSTYSYNETSSSSIYITSQNSTRDLTDLQGAAVAGTPASATALNVPYGATWTNKLTENDTTIGLGSKKGGFMNGKLDLTGDVTYSLGKSGYATQLNYVSATTGGLTCSSPQFETCGDLPVIKNSMVQLKLGGNYKVDKSSNVRVVYMFQRLTSNDYLYTAYQYGGTPTTMLPTNQQAPSYKVNVVAVSYSYVF